MFRINAFLTMHSQNFKINSLIKFFWNLKNKVWVLNKYVWIGWNKVHEKYQNLSCTIVFCFCLVFTHPDR